MKTCPDFRNVKKLESGNRILNQDPGVINGTYIF